jgi:hypothetical protein
MNRARSGAHDAIDAILRASITAVLGLSWIGILDRLPECLELLDYALGLPVRDESARAKRANANARRQGGSDATRARLRQHLPLDTEIVAFANRVANQRLRTFQAFKRRLS